MDSSVLTEFWGPASHYRFYIVRVGGQPYQAHETPLLSCIFRDIPLTHFFLMVPNCGALLLLGGSSQSGSLYFFCCPICLTPGLPAIPLLQTTWTNTPFPFMHSEVDSPVMGHPKPLDSQTWLLLSFNCKTSSNKSPSLNTHFISKASGVLTLSSLT